MPLTFTARAACDKTGCTHRLDLETTADGVLDVAEQLDGLGWGVYALTVTDSALPWTETTIDVRCPDHLPKPDEPATAGQPAGTTRAAA